jgi:regulation of enolase protein 1 (concanavalin A-like superfamily)
MTDIDWNSGTWTTAPARVEIGDDGMRVTAVEGSDAWRITSYGFIHDTEHALLVPFEQNSAMEVAFHLDFEAQFDQAGIFVKVDDTTWIKTGVERSDGEDSLGAVVTRGMSDWSLSPVPGWHGRLVTIRASRSGDALTIGSFASHPSTPTRQLRRARCAARHPEPTSPFTSRRGASSRPTRACTPRTESGPLALSRGESRAIRRHRRGGVQLLRRGN